MRSTFAASQDYFFSQASFAVPSDFLLENHPGGGGGDRTVPGTPAKSGGGNLAGRPLTQQNLLDSSFGVVPFTPPPPLQTPPPPTQVSLIASSSSLSGFSRPMLLLPSSSQPLQQVPNSQSQKQQHRVEFSRLPKSSAPSKSSTTSSAIVNPREKRRETKSHLCRRQQVIEERAKVFKEWMPENEQKEEEQGELDWLL